MPITHFNRRGDTYFLQVSATRTGKANYSFTRNLSKTPIESIPAGFEVHESPDTGQVFLRKSMPTRITPTERETAERAVRKLIPSISTLVEIDGDSIVIYTSDSPSAHLRADDFPMLSGVDRFKAMLSIVAAQGRYTKMLKFTLDDNQLRTFIPYRWCFRGSIDNWLPLFGHGDLSKLLAKYVPHLGNESFFELS